MLDCYGNPSYWPVDCHILHTKYGRLTFAKYASCFSFLSGNVVKTILHDFEEVKRAISSRSIVSISTFRTKIRQDIADAQLTAVFPTEVLYIERKVRTSTLTAEDQNVVENQVQFLKFITKLREIIDQAKLVKGKATSSRSSFLESEENSDDEEIDLMECELKDLLQWVTKFRFRFNDQELEEFNEELHRAWLLFSYLALHLEVRMRKVSLSDTENEKMEYLKRTLEAGSNLSKYYAGCSRNYNNIDLIL